MKELKIYKYTKNAKKQINAEFMAGMTKKRADVALFSQWSLLKRKILEMKQRV